jgi:cysteine synthase A
MNHQKRVYDSILELAANVDNPTPIVRLHRVIPFKHAIVYGKLEWFNPFGAVKDRVAANLVRDAEEHGQLPPRTRLVEPTSGNTGMALAMIANAKGYSLTATMSNKVPLEKRDALRMFGTNLIELEDELCPAPGAPEGAIAKAAELGLEPGSFHLNQYKNPANPTLTIERPARKFGDRPTARSPIFSRASAPAARSREPAASSKSNAKTSR